MCERELVSFSLKVDHTFQFLGGGVGARKCMVWARVLNSTIVVHNSSVSFCRLLSVLLCPSLNLPFDICDHYDYYFDTGASKTYGKGASP